MGTYDDHCILDNIFRNELGRGYGGDIPDALIRSIATFCDKHPDDTMMPFYVAEILGKFWKERSCEQWQRFFQILGAQVRHKRVLMAIYQQNCFYDEQLARCDTRGLFAAWDAIRELDDGYHKSNLIKEFAPLFPRELIPTVYQAALRMPATYRIRALAGIYPSTNEQSKAAIFAYLSKEFAQGAGEAICQLKLLFPALTEERRAELASMFLNVDKSDESDLGYFVIRNADHMNDGIAQRMAERIRRFRSSYLKNRALLKLAHHLPSEEIDTLYREFMKSFRASPPNAELLHNLYHFSAVRTDLDNGVVTDMALEKIALFDDSNADHWAQEKYHQLAFLAPHLEEQDKDRAFAIAETVRGNYRRQLISKLKRRFLKGQKSFTPRGAPICY